MPGKFISATAPYHVVPVVLPEAADPAISGRLRNVPCAPHINNGLVVRTSDGEWVLSPGLDRKGYSLLEDLYIAERNPEGWAAYKEYLRDMAAGTTRSSFPRELLPKEVLRRQGIEAKATKDKWARPATSAIAEAPSSTPARAIQDLEAAVSDARTATDNAGESQKTLAQRTAAATEAARRARSAPAEQAEA